jgi:hypothetical protein
MPRPPSHPIHVWSTTVLRLPITRGEKRALSDEAQTEITAAGIAPIPFSATSQTAPYLARRFFYVKIIKHHCEFIEECHCFPRPSRRAGEAIPQCNRRSKFSSIFFAIFHGIAASPRHSRMAGLLATTSFYGLAITSK